MDPAQALEELLAREGFDGEELLAWAKERADALVGEDAADLEGLDDLLEGLPAVGNYTEGAPAAGSGASSERELLGDADDGFDGLRTGNFDVVDEEIADDGLGLDDEVAAEAAEDTGEEMELSALQTGEYEIVDAEIENDPDPQTDAGDAGLDDEALGIVEAAMQEMESSQHDVDEVEAAAASTEDVGDEEEELEALQSGEYEMVDPDDLEELDMDELEEVQSGELQLVEDDEDDEASKAAPPAPAAIDEDDDSNELDIDLDF